MTTTINKRIFFSILVLFAISGMYVNGVFSFSSTASVDVPGSYIKPLSKIETVKFIYRGIPTGHPMYSMASDGISKPFGGNSNIYQHRDGNTNSPFTSWTTDIVTAYNYATTNVYGKCSGIILMKKVDLSNSRFVDGSTMHGGDIYGEKEILVKGYLDGCIPIKVSPGMSSNEVLKYLKILK